MATAAADSVLLFAVWAQDSTWPDYNRCLTGHSLVLPFSEEAMVARSNAAAMMFVNDYDYIGWVADDNRFETPGWDEQVIRALEERPGGVVYGNDVVSPGSKPSHVFMDARIPRTLGWFLHPDMRSTFFDDVWEQIGRGLGTLRYLPEVRIPHLYTERDNHEDFFHDMEVYQRWMRHDLDADLERVRRALRPRRSPRGRPTLAPSSPSGVSS